MTTQSSTATKSRATAAAEAAAGVLEQIQTGYFEEAHQVAEGGTRDDITDLDVPRVLSGEETDSGGFWTAPRGARTRDGGETMAELGGDGSPHPFDAELPPTPAA